MFFLYKIVNNRIGRPVPLTLERNFMYRVRLSDIQIYFISSHTHENTVIVYYTVILRTIDRARNTINRFQNLEIRLSSPSYLPMLQFHIPRLEHR